MCSSHRAERCLTHIHNNTPVQHVLLAHSCNEAHGPHRHSRATACNRIQLMRELRMDLLRLDSANGATTIQAQNESESNVLRCIGGRVNEMCAVRLLAYIAIIFHSGSFVVGEAVVGEELCALCLFPLSLSPVSVFSASSVADTLTALTHVHVQ